MAGPAPNGEDSDPYEDRRACPRVPVAMPAFLQVNGERHAVHLLDLSAGGAKLNCSAILPTGTAGVLDCGSLGREITALIARSIALDTLMKARG